MAYNSCSVALNNSSLGRVSNIYLGIALYTILLAPMFCALYCLPTGIVLYRTIVANRREIASSRTGMIQRQRRQPITTGQTETVPADRSRHMLHLLLPGVAFLIGVLSLALQLEWPPLSDEAGLGIARLAGPRRQNFCAYR